ncbi:hypothetical protein [Mesotoga prima]|jgi:hypothetical protein|uniref:hypothetical protein n=1 Tax=Mesotoga prima TaxID=1184387 RepID=UPI002D1FB2C2|nr:hypothetical protein [Mesotoga prima]
MTDATAAPTILIPHPKMKTGKSATLRRTSETIATMNFWALPSALTRLFMVMFIMVNIDPIMIIFVYSLVYSIIVSVGPKAVRRGSRNISPGTVKAVPVAKLVKRAVDAA